MMKKVLNWFEIPATDFDRAVSFYRRIFNVELWINDAAGAAGYRMAIFPTADGVTTGAIVAGGFFKPGSDGAVLYLSAGDDLSAVLDRVEAAGGRVIAPKNFVSKDAGYTAFFLDTEGNRVGLQSPT
ncbi:MAG: VOC family protein [Myxococcales bacterium]|nr:VOC family protein [Myxococcales bacterium]